VIVIDVNLLVYATFKNSPQHEPARTWVDHQLTASTRVGLPWETLIGFLRISTNPRIVEYPMPMNDAWRQVEDWLSYDPVWIPQPTERHGQVLATLLAESGVRANIVHDAHLAALAIEHGLTLCSTDGDFARFRELNWINPLAQQPSPRR
jgi:toxin-antitoxin system PIN domain toxin